MKNSDLGFTKENVVLLNFLELSRQNNNKYDVLRDELLKDQNIRYVSGAFTLPGINSQMNIGVKAVGTSSDNSVNIQALPADFGFVKSLGLEITEGRDLSKDFSADRFESVLLNQTAVKALNLNNPVGTKLNIPGEDYKNGVKVVGVVRDFHIQSFHNKITPILIYINPHNYISVAVKVNPQNIDATLGYIKTVWNSLYPDISLNYKYLEDAYNNQYSAEEKTGQLLSVFTVLALFISCLGLFGFAFFIVRKRTKEVGIRKVMGAKVSGISVLLTRQFLLMIAISGVIACPVAYLLVRMWLRNFAFSVKLSWWIFPAAVCAELVIVLLTISWLSWRTATRNPVDALRYE